MLTRDPEASTVGGRIRRVTGIRRATGMALPGLKPAGIGHGRGEIDIDMPFELPGTMARPAPRPRRGRAATVPRARAAARAQGIMRTLGTATIVAVLVASLLLLAATSILLNNVVIQRSVELGKLDDARRSFRTENAMLAARIAHLSAPPRVIQRAERRLQMTPAAGMATFIYLDPAAVRERRAAQKAEARAQAEVASAVGRGEAILNGAVFLLPPGVELGPRSVSGDGAPAGSSEGGGGGPPAENDS